MTNTFVIADDPSVDGCFPVGEYRLEETFYYGESPRESQTWGFTLDIS